MPVNRTTNTFVIHNELRFNVLPFCSRRHQELKARRTLGSGLGLVCNTTGFLNLIRMEIISLNRVALMTCHVIQLITGSDCSHPHGVLAKYADISLFLLATTLPVCHMHKCMLTRIMKHGLVVSPVHIRSKESTSFRMGDSQLRMSALWV